MFFCACRSTLTRCEPAQQSDSAVSPPDVHVLASVAHSDADAPSKHRSGAVKIVANTLVRLHLLASLSSASYP
eukprot:375157-Rhodomonas_salina.1